MKKRLLALSMAVVMAFGLTACGGSSSGNAGTTTAAAGGSETTAAAASGKTYKIKLHHDLAEDSSQHEGLVKFKELVEEKSGGAVQIQIFPNNTLGSDEEVAEMLQTGSVEAALIPTAKLSGFYAPLQLLDLPFVFPNREPATVLWMTQSLRVCYWIQWEISVSRASTSGSPASSSSLLINHCIPQMISRA